MEVIPATSAKYVSELFGREAQQTRSQGRSGHGTSHNLSVATSSQERFVVRPPDVTGLPVGVNGPIQLGQGLRKGVGAVTAAGKVPQECDVGRTRVDELVQ